MKNQVFIGREDELQTLESLLKKKTSNLVVVKGRRRVGKSRLLEQFVEGKKYFLFRGLAPNEKTTAQSQRNEFARQLAEATGLPEVKLDDWSKLFALLAREVNQGKIIIIFDEVSWIGSKDPDFTAKIKDAWEHYFKKNSNLMLILCGSISIWIDEYIVNSTGFYGRISWTLTLQPLSLSEAKTLLHAYGFKGSTYEIFQILSVTGGFPWYIELMQGDYSAEENIKRQCFTSSGILFSEYDRIFKEMFGRMDHVYKKIISALISKPLNYKQLSETIQYKSSGRFSQYLSNLEVAGFIKKEHLWNLKEGTVKNTCYYRLSDNYLRFYLKYIAPKKPQIERDIYKLTSITSLPGWEAIMGLQFENLVANNRLSIIKSLNLRLESIIYDAPYIQKPGTHTEGCQIDYLIQMKYKTLFLIETKFSRNEISKSIIKETETKISKLKIPRNMVVLPVLVHVNGVKQTVIEQDYFYAIINFHQLLEDER